MTTPLLILAVWSSAAVLLALIIGRLLRGPDPAPPPPQPDPHWSQAAIDAEFAALIPSLVTAESFALDAQLNRQGRREWLA